MIDSAQRRGFNAPLLIVLAIVGLVILMLWARGCWSYTFGLHWPFQGQTWRFGLFNVASGMLGLWWLIQGVLAVWVGVDANRRGLNGVLWGLLVFFTSIVGLLVYLIVSPTLEGQRETSAPTSASVAAPPPPQAGQASPSAAAAPAAPEAGAAAVNGTAPRATSGCAKCGGPIRSDFQVCPQCGNPVKAECADCGSFLEAGWKVCPYCGKPIGGASTVRP